MRRIAARYRTLAIHMGGVLIKVGQFMSSRLDVMPREITSELAGLQDEVGAESFEAIRGEVEAEFGGPLSSKFFEFDPVPVASASIGQVHRARLCAATAEGEPCPPVVVKVQRPRIQQIVEADLAAIRVAGSWLQRFKSVRRHANVPALIEEFRRSLYEELDYLHEGKNAERFALNFAGQPGGGGAGGGLEPHDEARSHPARTWGRSRSLITRPSTRRAIDRAEVAEKLLDVYLKQVFEDGFFHADPHPGNLFVLPAPTPGPARWLEARVRRFRHDRHPYRGRLQRAARSAPRRRAPGTHRVSCAPSSGCRCSSRARTWTSSSARARGSSTRSGGNPPVK